MHDNASGDRPQDNPGNNRKNKPRPAKRDKRRARTLQAKVAKTTATAYDLYMSGKLSLSAYTATVKDGKAVMDAYNAAYTDVETHIRSANTANRRASLL